MIRFKLFVFVFFFLFIQLNPCPKKDWIKLSKVDETIEITECELNVIMDVKFYDKANEENYNFMTDDKDLKLRDYKRLSKFIKRYQYKYPNISKIVKVKFINKHKIIFVDEASINGTPYNPLLIFVIDNKNDNVYRFGKFEWEIGEITNGIYKDEVKIFNNLIKKEKIKVNDPSLALDICRFLLLLNKTKMEDIVFDKNKLISKMIINGKHIPLDLQIKYTNIINDAMYITTPKYYLINFYTFEKNNNVFWFEHWIFKVNKNGEVIPLENKLFQEELNLDNNLAKAVVVPRQ